MVENVAAARFHNAAEDLIGRNILAGRLSSAGFIAASGDDTAPANALPNDLIAFDKKDLANFKYPRWIIYTDGLPETVTGKIQRYTLRETA